MYLFIPFDAAILEITKKNTSKDVNFIIDFLEYELKLSILFTPPGKKILIPPIFYFESPICQTVIRRLRFFVDSGVISLYTNESDFNTFREKKTLTYFDVKKIDKYSNAYFKNHNHNIEDLFFDLHLKTISHGDVAHSLWESQVLKNAIKYKIDIQKIVDLFKRISDSNIQNSTWESISKFCDNFSEREINFLDVKQLSRATYSDSYRFNNINIIIGSKFAPTTLTGKGNNDFDISIFRNFLESSKLNNLFLSLTEEKILELRNHPFIRNSFLKLSQNEYPTLNEISNIQSIFKNNLILNNNREDMKLYTSFKDFLKLNKNKINEIIIDNWKISKTQLPGEFNSVYARCVKWFSNFDILELHLALKVMEKVELYNNYDLNELIEYTCQEATKLVDSNFTNVAFFGLGNTTNNSGNQFLYLISKKLRLKNYNFPIDFKNLPENFNTIIFIDDIIGTGNQATRFSKRHLKNIPNVKKYFFVLIAFESGLKNLRQNSFFDGIFPSKIFKNKRKAFSSNSEIFPDKSLKRKLKKIALKYGKELYPEGPLGYESSEAMIVFPHNTPNNTLPIIWASPKNEKTNDVPWNPLFERIKH